MKEQTKKIIAREGLILLLVILLAIAISNFVNFYQGLLIGRGLCRISPVDDFYLRSLNLDIPILMKYKIDIMLWRVKIVGSSLIVLFYLLIRFILWAIKTLKEK